MGFLDHSNWSYCSTCTIDSGSVATISCSVVGRGVEVGSDVDRGGRGSGSGSSIISRSESGCLAWVAVVDCSITVG